MSPLTLWVWPPQICALDVTQIVHILNDCLMSPYWYYSCIDPPQGMSVIIPLLSVTRVSNRWYYASLLHKLPWLPWDRCVLCGLLCWSRVCVCLLIISMVTGGLWLICRKSMWQLELSKMSTPPVILPHCYALLDLISEPRQAQTRSAPPIQVWYLGREFTPTIHGVRVGTAKCAFSLSFINPFTPVLQFTHLVASRVF
jgi:hypothetical protein